MTFNEESSEIVNLEKHKKIRKLLSVIIISCQNYNSYGLGALCL